MKRETARMARDRTNDLSSDQVTEVVISVKWGEDDNYKDQFIHCLSLVWLLINDLPAQIWINMHMGTHP